MHGCYTMYQSGLIILLPPSVSRRYAGPLTKLGQPSGRDFGQCCHLASALFHHNFKLIKKTF